MIDFAKIKEQCDSNTSISATVIDDFILHYAAAKDDLAREFDYKIASYKHVTRQAQASWVNMMKSQYIIHRVFKADGLLRKYLNHTEIKRRPAGQQEFLQQQLNTPWRFSFSIIAGNPAQDFYQMEDVFSGDSYLLYSRSVTQILKEQSALLWFTLIGFNGSCWQTFGPLNAYQSFDQDDIFFFATELNPRIDSEEDLLQDVEKNPIPYMLLLTGARMPVTANKNDELLILSSEHPMETLDTSGLKDDFKIEYNSGVFRFSLKGWDEPPHLAAAYFDEEESQITITSMTERSFVAFIKKLNEYGFGFSDDAQIRIHPSMLIAIEDILKRKLTFNSYEKLFTPETSPAANAEIEKLNILLQSAISSINAGETPDIEALAKKAGVAPEVAKQIVTDTVARIDAMKKVKR
jgi:hypothetical protein